MPPLSRKVAFTLLAALALASASCNANAKKIVGKWKLTDAAAAKKGETKDNDKIVLFLEFKEDGTGQFGIEVNDPELKKLFGESKDKLPTFKYKVSGNTLELFDLPKDGAKGEGPFAKKDRVSARMVFDGDNSVTLTSDDEKEKPVLLTRMK